MRYSKVPDVVVCSVLLKFHLRNPPFQSARLFKEKKMKFPKKLLIINALHTHLERWKEKLFKQIQLLVEMTPSYCIVTSMQKLFHFEADSSFK